MHIYMCIWPGRKPESASFAKFDANRRVVGMLDQPHDMCSKNEGTYRGQGMAPMTITMTMSMTMTVTLSGTAFGLLSSRSLRAGGNTLY